MYSTTYHRVSSVDEAVKLLGDCDEAALLSGGQTLLPTMKARLAAPSDLIDLGRIDALKGISVDGRSVKIGAGTTHAEIHASKEIAAVCPGLHEMTGVLGDPAVRHMGTLGGSLANNDPAADYPAAILALDATIHTSKREIEAGQFLVGLFETALEDDEIITAVSFEAPERSGYEKFRNPASRYAMCGVFVAKSAETVRVGVTGAGGDGAFRWEAAEEALAQRFEASALEGLSLDPSEMLGDLHGSPEYRANLVRVMAKRALAKA
ncbi:FAD binding domain-containing protein [Pararhizobium mangrovi]|uniref:Xanthine dehydrogenase family protein subunit M n=1 Tax=Pararhizobium mangrovi TaxID=2590452 RepID=A0A506UFT0_9HYPH|nr:xanthine dehydrogenase family protein subunit M [Pararhizobium mangrovi]TPW30717.1 xanthine dehydrogenase family protein subunit M [Pararhizobium mangrovi]